MIRLLVADDHQLFADGIRSMLADMHDILLVGTAANGGEVLQHLENKEVDLVLMDIRMPGLDGVDTTRIMRERFPDVKVIVISMYNETEYIRQILELGAEGYMLKNADRKELLSAIHRVHDGGTWFGREVTDKLLNETYRNHPNSANETPTVDLTPRELDVLREIANELTTAAIADKLCVSTHTVETHRKNLLSKIGVRNSIGLVKYALNNNLLDN